VVVPISERLRRRRDSRLRIATKEGSNRLDHRTVVLDIA
jgi:hypothetical protein